MCGADIDNTNSELYQEGLPSRVRSRRGCAARARMLIGITFACAEQTVVFYCVLSQLNGVEYLIYALRRVS